MSIKRKNRNPRFGASSVRSRGRQPGADFGNLTPQSKRRAHTNAVRDDNTSSVNGDFPAASPPGETDASDRFEKGVRGQPGSGGGGATASPGHQTQNPQPLWGAASEPKQVDSGWLETLRIICRDFRAAEGPFRVLTGASFGGVNQKFVLEDEVGTRFFWKSARPQSFGIERTLLANALRAQAGEAVLPLFTQSIEIQGQILTGLCTPLLDNDGNLDYDVHRFRPQEKNAVLADMPWAYVLGNWDTKPDQYLRLAGTAMNVDWDQCLSDFAAPATSYSRHTHPHFVSVARPVQSALLLGYVRGQVEADLGQMRASAERIAALSDETVRDSLEPLFQNAYRREGNALPGLPNESSVLDAVRSRRDAVPYETERLVADLENERERIAQPMRMVDVRLLPNALADLEMNAAIAAARSPLLNWVYAAGQWFSALQTKGAQSGGDGQS